MGGNGGGGFGGPPGAGGGGQGGGRRARGGDAANGGQAGDPSTPRRQRRANPGYEIGTVWLEDGKGYVKPQKVKVSHSDGVMTQLVSDEIKEGDKLVIGELRQDETPSGTTNPFMPQVFGRRRG